MNRVLEPCQPLATASGVATIGSAGGGAPCERPRPCRFIGGLAACAVALAVAAPSSALAQEAPPPPPPPIVRRPPTTVLVTPTRPQDVVVVEQRSPNTDLIGSGILLFGLSYGSSVVVGAASGRDADQNLLVPVAGPWMDLATRGPCQSWSCGTEAANKVLLVTDGLLQAAGVLQILGGFLFPETRTVTRTLGGVQITPTASPHGVGVSVRGVF